MKDKIEAYLSEISTATANTNEDLEKFRLRFISRKGVLAGLFDEFKSVPNEQKREMGSLLNVLKQNAQTKFKELVDALEAQNANDQAADIDVTLPSREDVGSMHPLSQVKNRIIQIFERQGFNVAEGPEIEDDFHNFTALNFPENHPAREMQDTYFIEKNPDTLLRTHTSNVQIRLMEHGQPPFRSIMPGRVYRNEAISARAHCFFNQVEGLYVDKNVSFKDLKQTLYHFAQEMFGKGTQIRFRPSYFPFTEPSAEIDISCFICGGNGCKICKNTGWVEIGGSGMVDPNVLEACGIDSKEYSGFAFGMGIERITMLKYQIDDIRLFSENDLRFLKQF
ncbi:phenylalanine--tRNA ligase subunit alpha [Marinoscillum furvescens]|uniref:Phenylalanine--tRNA ligase alpha subunit n=1 Tax=Marinoscillum furvescens DSM 4134 TaxID=1122208 RepID=A0A3D9L693_MARFU|nr:phenylalanine--tRNA ligase subunit alpha [Marinoscillum furvescens]REE01624.1 phenylalanyl-tRNA synthetase alpha subunit [Marinoscillum furvescens DSM 4134]